MPFSYSERLTKFFMTGAPFLQAFPETKHNRQNPIMRIDDDEEENGGGGSSIGSSSRSGNTDYSIME